jgi:hypothetical protein
VRRQRDASKPSTVHGPEATRAPFTVRRCAGQESQDDRHATIEDPTDILLACFVMLDSILTRRHEKGLVAAAKDLKYLVFDELHTYLLTDYAQIAEEGHVCATWQGNAGAQR